MEIEPGVHFCVACGISFGVLDGEKFKENDNVKCMLHWDWITIGKKIRYVLNFVCQACGHKHEMERIPSRKEQKELVKAKGR